MKVDHQSIWVVYGIALPHYEFSAKILGIKVPFFVVTFKEGLEVFVVPHLSRSGAGGPGGPGGAIGYVYIINDWIKHMYIFMYIYICILYIQTHKQIDR